MSAAPLDREKLDREKLMRKLLRTLTLAIRTDLADEALASLRGARRLLEARGATLGDVFEAPAQELAVALDAARHLLGENEALRTERDWLRAVNGPGGAVWHDVGAAAAAEARQRTAQWALALHAVDKIWLSDEEIRFLGETIPRWHGPLRPKQAAWLEKILGRIFERTGMRPPP